MPKAAIFDVDGTLLDSVDLHALAWHEAMVKFGHDVGFEQVRGQIGKGGDKLIPHFLSEGAQRNHGKELEEWRGAVLKKLDMGGGDAVAIGDTPYDSEAAGKAGLRTIGVLCGGFTEDSLRQAGCAEVRPGPATLLACFAESLLAK